MKKHVIWSLILITSLAFSQNRSLQVEPNHSTIGFKISIAGFSTVTGKFTDFQIDLDWDDNNISDSKLSSVIQVSSINTGIPDRDTHLKSADFFDAETYPSITFESESIQQIDYSHFNVSGKFSMHGVTKEVVLPFQIVKLDGNTIGFKCETTINRLEYGVGSGFKHTSMPDFLAENINVEIYFWTKKKK